MGIFEALKNALKVLAYFFDPRVRRRREKERLWNRLRALEEQYGMALENGDPQAAAQLAAQMEDLREKIKYLEGTE